VQVLAVRSAGESAAFAQLVRNGREAEITEVYVDRRHRGAGLGTALARAAIEPAGDVQDLWICADDEDRPKEHYARL
jgi:ribosomal protein S18 acetylase RimI-like enzyme